MTVWAPCNIPDILQILPLTAQAAVFQQKPPFQEPSQEASQHQATSSQVLAISLRRLSPFPWHHQSSCGQLMPRLVVLAGHLGCPTGEMMMITGGWSRRWCSFFVSLCYLTSGSTMSFSLERSFSGNYSFSPCQTDVPTKCPSPGFSSIPLLWELKASPVRFCARPVRNLSPNSSAMSKLRVASCRRMRAASSDLYTPWN